MADQDTITMLTETITNHVPGLIGIWLYGSAASGEDTPDSDIDLAILAEKPLPLQARMALSSQLMSQTARDVDLVELRTAPTVLRKEVIAHGRRLYCAETNTCELFEDYAFADYARLNEERAGILEDIFDRGRIHG